MSNVRFVGYAAGVFFAFVITLDADAADNSASVGKHPDITGSWTRGRTVDSAFRPNASGPGPVRAVKGAQGGEVYRQGDAANPILQPWAADVVRTHAETERAGTLIRSAKEACWPMGVPYVLQLNGRAQIVDNGKEIVILYHELMHQRIVRLNAVHPANVKPTWYGDSVAEWDADMLVVDTVGLDKRSWVDSFGTPHTDKLHVVEKYHLRDPNTLDVAISVEDSGTFTTPWSAAVTYRKDRGEYEEIVCAENNRDEASGGLYPIPTAQRPDF